MKTAFVIFLFLSSYSYAQKDSPYRAKFVGETIVSEVDGKIGLIDPDSNILIPHEYEAIYPNGGFTITKKDGKLGVFKVGQGIIFLPNEYEAIDKNGSFIQTKKDGKYGLIHEDGKVLIPNEYDKMRRDGSLVYTVKDGKMGLYSFKGKELIPNEFDHIKSYGGVVMTRKDRKFGLLTRKGKFILPNEFETIDLTHDEAVAWKEGKAEVHSIKKYNKGWVIHNLK